MVSLSSTKFTKDDISKKWLVSNGFRYNKIFSDKDEDVYTYRFPVHKYGDYITLEAEVAIFLNNGKVILNVFDGRTRCKYAPFYYIEFGDYGNFIKEINNNIINELNRLGIKEAKEIKRNGSKNKKNKS